MKNVIKMSWVFIICLVANLHGYVLQNGDEVADIGKPLLNKETTQLLCLDASWSWSHGSDEKSYLGGGLLYYSLVYIKKAQMVVCLGSGGGFVPRLMKQAQRDLQLKNAQTILVDGNIGPYGTPKWLDESSSFRRNYPDIKILIERTDEASKTLIDYPKIDYLHIDADHSFEGCKRDFYDYLPLMKKDGIITFHDTGLLGCQCRGIVKHLRDTGYNVVNFFELGCGLALIQLGDNNGMFTK